MPLRKVVLWSVDEDDPRAPPQVVWDGMSAAKRAHVVDSLPRELPATEACPPEGDVHYEAVARTRSSLRGHFRRLRRRIYVGNGLPVYYPAEAMFSPDLLAVLDVEDRTRNSWVVSAEGKGLDLALEIHWLGHRLKDVQRNVVRYAALGIGEYFVCDLRRLVLRGYRLVESGAASYEPVVPQGGRLSSMALGLELALEGDRLRFYHGLAALPDADELIARLDAGVAAAKERAESEAQRAEDAERRLAEALARIEQLEAELSGKR
ncbi:MAG: Uma2 family endonuclease [Deltaproteobacteria bacterium]|nr:Uma2 family endonuclease [Deltaproteobacteria bacterium]